MGNPEWTIQMQRHMQRQIKQNKNTTEKKIINMDPTKTPPQKPEMNTGARNG